MTDTEAHAALDAVAWMPIESAPKDGSFFIARNADHHQWGCWPMLRWVTWRYSDEINSFICEDRGAWLHVMSLHPDYDEGHVTGSIAAIPFSIAPDDLNSSVRYEWMPLADLAKAQERIDRLEDVVRKCRDQFDFYVANHLAKQPPDMDKAATNQEFVELCDAALGVEQ